jgi:CHASE2 domain-containing sensor protein
MVKRRFWTTDGFAGLVLTLVFLFAANSSPVAWLDGKAYDVVASLTSEPAGPADVAVIGIDHDSLAELGPWPWPRDRIAELLRSLRGVRAVGLALPLEQPQYPYAIRQLDGLREQVPGAAGRALLGRLREKLATDEQLRSALRATRGILGTPSETLAPQFDFSLDTTREDALHSLPSVVAAGPPRLALAKPRGPFAEYSPSFPLIVPVQARAIPLTVLADGRLGLTFTAALVARSVGGDSAPIELAPGKPLKLAGHTISVDWGGRVYPRYSADVPVYSFAEVLRDPKLRASLRGSTVVVGLTAPELAGTVQLPDGASVAPVVASARAAADVMGEAFYRVPAWAVWAQVAAIAVAGLFLMLLLPRLRRGTGFLLTLLLTFLLLNAHFVLMSAYGTWVPLMAANALLVAGFAVISAKRLARERHQGLQMELSGANRQLGQALHAQGQLDAAFEKYRNCVVDETLLEQLYNLGLDYERKRHFSRAAGVFDHLQRCRKGFRDVGERAKRNREMEGRVVLGNGGNASPTGTVIMSAEGLQKPILGRYQVEKELGRGAMGLVYLGRDPKIGRTVAIKTMALSQEFDDEALVEVRERFFREAETAGRLDHPNIVTVYDVGEEQDLAYIAMDYLKGVPLSEFCKPDRLLPVKEALKVAAQVADALDYAHGQNVVHRDVKPANIIYDRESGIAKVTDFGVACLTDSSKTKTGTVLGSPSYMSPEQFAGTKVDGRSDLFSLGVTLFQLLTGTLPFSGDSFATLMYRIANEKHPDVRKLRKGIPACAPRVVNKALQKEAARRYASGQKLAEALRRCAGE